METATQAPAGEQPADITDQTPAGEQPADRRVAPATSPLENLSSAQLLAALEATEHGEESSTEIEEHTEQEEPEAPVAQEEAAPAVDPETTTENRPLRRLPLGGIEEAQRNEFADAAALIREGKAKTLAEAVSLLRGDDPQETPPAVTDRNDPAPPPQVPASVAAIQDQIATLREQRKAAKIDYDTDAELSITDQIEDLQMSLVRAEMAERENMVIAKNWDAKHTQACDEVETKFNDFAKLNPAFYELLETKRDAMEAKNDPSLRDPRFIVKEAEKIAAILGWNKPVTPAPKAKAGTPNGQDLAPAHQSAARITRAEAQRAIHQMPIEDLKALICTE